VKRPCVMKSGMSCSFALGLMPTNTAT